MSQSNTIVLFFWQSSAITIAPDLIMGCRFPLIYTLRVQRRFKLNAIQTHSPFTCHRLEPTQHETTEPHHLLNQSEYRFNGRESVWHRTVYRLRFSGDASSPLSYQASPVGLVLLPTVLQGLSYGFPDRWRCREQSRFLPVAWHCVHAQNPESRAALLT